jgi:long-subunit fatty acid transport protein
VVRFEDFLNSYTFAFSIIVPEYDNFKGDIANTQTDISSLAITDESLWVGGAISKKIDESQSWGLTIYYTARSLMKSVVNRTFVGAEQFLYTEDRAIKENFVVMVLGYQRKLNDQWSFGFSARPQSYQIFGSGSYYEALIDTAGTTDYVINQPGLKSKIKIPAKVALGMGWKFSSEWLFSADVAFYPPTNYSDLEDTTRAELIEHNQVINAALGAEYAWRDWLKFRVGGFTNFSSHPNPDPQKVSGQADHVDQLGFSANAALKSGPIQYTFGGYYTGGWGRSVQRVNQVYQVVPKAQQVFTMLVGTSF